MIQRVCPNSTRLLRPISGDGHLLGCCNLASAASNEETKKRLSQQVGSAESRHRNKVLRQVCRLVQQLLLLSVDGLRLGVEGLALHLECQGRRAVQDLAPARVDACEAREL